MTPLRLQLLIASISGLAGFLVALIAGMNSGNLMESVLERAVFALAVCCLGGLVVGHLLDGVRVRHAQELRIAKEAEASIDQSSPEFEGRMPTRNSRSSAPLHDRMSWSSPALVEQATFVVY